MTYLYPVCEPFGVTLDQTFLDDLYFRLSVVDVLFEHVWSSAFKMKHIESRISQVLCHEKSLKLHRWLHMLSAMVKLIFSVGHSSYSDKKIEFHASDGFCYVQSRYDESLVKRLSIMIMMVVRLYYAT